MKEHTSFFPQAAGGRHGRVGTCPGFRQGAQRGSALRHQQQQRRALRW